MTFNPLLSAEPLMAIIAVSLAGGLFLAWRSSARLAPRWRWVVLVGRGVALAALAMIALNPGSWRKPGTDHKPRWIVLLDRSGSMATGDVEGRSRWEAARRLALSLDETAAGRREVEIIAFSYDVDGARQSAASLAALSPDGHATDIGRTVTSMTGPRASGDGKSVGLVLLSDGRQTVRESDVVQAGLRARAQDAPIYAVPFGAVRAIRDIAVKASRRLVIGYVGQPVRVRGEVTAQWPNEISVAVRLVDEKGSCVATNMVTVPAQGHAPVSFTVIPSQTGYAGYTMQVAPWEGESDARNNESAFEIHALDRKIRVLLIEGVPYWDSKFLGQHLRKQSNMEVTAVYRTAPDRFFRIDPSGEPRAESKAVFPETAAELSAYDIVVFGRGIEYYLTPERLAALKAFVSDQGGSVVFARGKPYADQGAGIEELEPLEWGGASAVECSMTPRAEGEDIGLFAGLLPGGEDAVWSRLPPVRCGQMSAGLKSFAQILAEGRHSGSGEAAAPSIPLLVSRRYGKGMTVTMNVEGLWQWSFFPTAKDAEGMYEELWTQLLLWVGTYAEFLPGHEYGLHLARSAAFPDEAVRVRVRRRGAGGSGAAAPTLRVTRGSEVVREVALSDGERDREWEAVLTLSEPGLYRVSLVVPGKGEGRTELGALLQVQSRPGEADNVNPDAGLLEALTAASGGSVLAAGELERAMARREQAWHRDTDEGTNRVWEPLWDRGWLLVIIVAALAAEWVVRRRNGLA